MRLECHWRHGQRGMVLRREDEGAERTFRRTDEAIIAQSPMAEIALSGLEPGHLATDLERPPSDRGGDQRRLSEPPAGAPDLGSPIRSITMSMNLVTSKGFCRI